MARDALATSAASTEQCLREDRNLSYLLHPPLLDGMGLVPALGSLAEGFSRRSGIQVELKVAPDFARLPTAVELAFYRIVQESLTNIYRYSGSPTATIRLRAVGDEIMLEVADQDRGISPEVLDPGDAHGLGVGIAGMRARAEAKMAGKEPKAAKAVAPAPAAKAAPADRPAPPKRVVRDNY